MTDTTSTTTSTAISPTMSSSRSFTPPPSGSLVGCHVIYRGLSTSSMEYMSLTHSKHSDAAHMMKGEILISGQNPGYVQYTIVLDHEWMTRKVKLSSMFGGQEKRLVLEVDHDQRWYKVTEHRLNRTRSFYRSGSGLALASGSPSSNASQMTSLSSSPSSVSESGSSQCSMQDADANLSDSTSCYSSSSDSECSIPFEKINLTWTPPPKGSKRASKRFSTATPLGAMSSSPLTTTITCTAASSASTIIATSPSTATATATSPLSARPASGFSSTASTKTLQKSVSTASLTGPKKYEHIPELDGCVHLDLGCDISPSTVLCPLRRATLGIEPKDIAAFLAELSTCEEDPSTTEPSAMLSFPDLELRAVKTHMTYVGPGHQENLSLVECWQDGQDPTLVEVDSDGLVVRYGRKWTRIPS